ncbi:MAG: DNA polymerase III subunit delta [Candidatus Berkelbacteria bacterium]
MIKLYYGEDTYSLNHAIKKIEADFSVANFGDMNIQKLDGANLTYDGLIRSASAVPFLADKRLLIINNFLRDGDEKLREYLDENMDKFPKSTEVILLEDGEVNKNLKLYKKLLKLKAVEHFPVRKGFELENWLSAIAKEKAVPIKASAIRKLIATAGNNSFRLTNELEKLDLFRLAQNQTEISEDDINQMVESENDQNIFDFIDALGARNSRLALKYLHNLLLGGKNENYILSMIVYQFRNMLIVQDLISRGVVRNQIPAEAELHPFVVGKTIRVLNNFDLPLLRRIYLRLQQTDLDIKTGRIDPRLALEKLLVDLTI